MAQNNFIQVRNLTTGTISGTVTIGSAKFDFSNVAANGGVSEYFNAQNLDTFDCSVQVEGAPHVGNAEGKGLQISGGTNAYFMLNVTQNGYVNMFPSAPAQACSIN